MFNIKNLINRVTNSNEGSNADESSPSHQHDEDQHSAEGFLCPLCMTAFSSPDALKVHYETLHSDPPEANSNSDDRSDNLSEIGEDIRNMQLEIENLQASLQKQKDYSKEVLKQYDQSQIQLKLQCDELRLVRNSEKELQAANALLTSDVTLLRQQLGERIEQISQLRKDNEQTVVNLTGDVDKIKQENSSLKVQLAHRNSLDDAEVLKQELVTVQKMMDEVSLQKEEEIQNLKQEITDMNKMAHEREQAFADAQLSFCEKLKEQNPTEILETQANIKIEQCMNNIQQLQKQLTEAESAKEELDILCNNMKMQKQSDDVQIGDLNKNLHNLKLELSQSTTEVARLVAEASTQAEQIERLQLQVKEKDENTKELAKENRDRLEKFEQETSRLSNSIQELSDNYGATIKDMERSAAELVAVNTNLQSEVEKQAEELKNSQSMISELQNSLKLANLEKSKVCKEIEEIRAEFSANLHQFKEESESQLLACQKEKQEALNEATSLKDRLNDLSIKVEAIEKEKIKLITTIEDVNQKIHEYGEKHEEEKISYECQIGNLKADLRQAVHELEIIQKEKEETAKSTEIVQKELRKHIEALTAKEKSFQSEVEEKERNINHIKAEMAESTSKLGRLQSQLDSVLVEKLEYEKNVKQNEHKYAVLMERCLADANEKEKLHDAMSELKRKLEDSNAALQELGRENQNLVMESAKLNGRQWADDALVTICTTCEREFTLTNRKHHCRHCGQIFCKDCSAKTAKIPSSKNPVRVCDACFEELMPK